MVRRPSVSRIISFTAASAAAFTGCGLMGLARGLEHCGLEPEGTPHRALDDARSAARILMWLMERGWTPDWITTPRIRSSTLIRLFNSTHIFEPCMRQARSLTGSVASSDNRPALSASKTMYMVMILLIDDGGMR